ncbi:MAG: DUF4177 domain-containing protein [Bacteroidetes bacterium]|nr:DUF4177 domain-containing protein [Bacteroidota bacterium]
MKKLIFILGLFYCGGIYAQTDTTMIEQYCQVVASQKIFSNKVTIDIDFGEARGLFQTNKVKDENGKSKTFNTVIDALNYLGKDGWRLVNAFPISNSTKDNTNTYYYYVFKKYFPKNDAANSGE